MFQPHTFEPAYVSDGCQEGKELSDDRRPCGSCNAQVKQKDEDRVEDGVEDGADEHTGHGIFRASVCTDQAAHAGGDDLKGHTQGDDP